MQGEGDMETAEPARTRELRIPDSLRCRRSDGRKWRCYQPVMPGLRFCEHHRMRCNREYNRATKFKITKPVKSSHLTSDPQRFMKRQRPWRRMEGEQIEEDLIMMEQNEEAQETIKLATTGLSFCDTDLLRCKVDNNKMKFPEPITLDLEAAKQARSEIVREEFSSHPPGFPADSSVVSTVEPATLEEGVMETLKRSHEQVETMRRSQEQDRLQLDRLLKDNIRLWDKVHHLEKSNKHYKEKISLLFSELTALKQRSPPSPPLLPISPLVRPQHKWQEDGASSRDPRMDKEIGWIHSMIAQINSHMAHSSIILSQVADVVAHLGRDRIEIL